MTAIETLEAAIARLESLRDRAFPGPYEPGVGGGDNWYLFANDESVAYISANDGSDEEQREPTARLIAALSRTVEHQIALMRSAIREYERWHGAVEQWANEAYRLARAILGEEQS